jgi:hypothetical protein
MRICVEIIDLARHGFGVIAGELRRNLFIFDADQLRSLRPRAQGVH